MNTSRQIGWFAVTLALLAGCAPGKTGRGAAAEQVLVVRVYDSAEIPAAELRSATLEAALLFRAAKIQISWEHPPTESPEDEGTDMTASSLQQPNDRPYLVLRLLRRTPPTLFPGALAYSLPFAHRGAHVLIFYDRVEALTQRLNVAGSVVLGHTMAHELGHVLLCSAEHTRGGLMQARWTPDTWRLASSGLLVFDASEIKRIRAGLPKFQLVERVSPPEVVRASFALLPPPR